GFADYVETANIGLISVIKRRHFFGSLRRNASYCFLRELFSRKPPEVMDKRISDQGDRQQSYPPGGKNRRPHPDGAKSNVAGMMVQLWYIDGQLEFAELVRWKTWRLVWEIDNRYHAVRMKHV